jgi:uncharacterized cupredoxin-like copper-binding protein
MRTPSEVHVLKLLVLPFALIALSLGLVACGGSDDDDNGGGSPSTASTPQNDGSSGSSGGAAQEVTVTAGERGEQYYFTVNNTNLKAGKVKVTLNNAGPERPHTFVVKTLDGNGNIAELDQVEPTKTGTLEFELPAAGSYQFMCELRGHADRGQKGTFTVS